MRSNQLISTARKLRRYIEENAADLTDEQALEIPAAFPNWKSGKEYAIGDRVRYGEKLYKCVQAHMAQTDWTPDAVKALWTEIAAPGDIPDWVQPTGAQDAYMTGDKVKHNGQTWVSTVDSNVWEPGVYGWGLVLS